MATPFQKISGKLVKAKIFNNQASLTYVINDYIWQTGENIDIKIKRSVACYPPDQVDARLVDGKNYLAGDLIMRIPYTVVMESRKPQAGDPEIILNTVKKTLEEMRPYDPATGGILVGVDTITFGGTVYKIGNVKGEQWMNNEPADYYFTLRS